MVIIALTDLYRNGKEATKFREYGFLVTTGVLGALFGFANDLITSTISPDYFTLGKGLDEGPDLQMRAGLYGLQVGFSAGIIGGGICLYLCRRKSAHPPAKISRLFQLLWMPVAGAVLCGILLPMALSPFDPAKFASQLAAILDAARISRFRQVWWTHVGLYAGMIIGLMAMIYCASKGRVNIRLTNPPNPSESGKMTPPPTENEAE